MDHTQKERAELAASTQDFTTATRDTTAARHTETQPAPDTDSADRLKHFRFVVVYNDTGADAIIEAPAGWTIGRVIDEAYERLKEPRRPGDRVEANGVLLDPYFAERAKGFVANHPSLGTHFDIICQTGGAATSYKSFR